MATFTAPTPDLLSGVTLRNIPWKMYCDLRDEPEHDHLNMLYLDGKLTIMSPEIRHDMGSRRIFLIVTTVASVWEINYMTIGTATLRRRGRGRKKGGGKEPDEGFYLGPDEALVRDHQTLDLRVDPPPSLVIEVDNWADSEIALPAYARIGVPEVWIYKVREHSLWFGRLVGESYRAIDRSLGLPRLTPGLVLQALEARAGGMGDRQWTRWLDAWARTLPEPPAEAR